MTTQLDWQAAKAAMLSIAGQYFGEIPRDRKVACPFHADGTASLHIYDDGWHCYGCGEGGDAVDLVERLERVSKVEALQRITGDNLTPLVSHTAPKKRKQSWQYHPGARGTPDHPHLGTPHETYAYLDAEGSLVGLICRWDQADGTKTIRPASSVRDSSGVIRWQWVGLPTPRPLYRCDHLRDKLVVVEGEKCVDHLRAMGIEACTWPGGADGVKHADWSRFKASVAYVWPDNDQPGHEAAAHVAELLAARGVEVRMVDVSDLEPGQDAADMADPAAIVARIKGSRPTIEPEAPKPQAPQWPFRCLGHRDGRYYILEQEGQTVLEKTTASLSRAGMLELAPLEWWMAMFPKGKDGWDHEAALNAVLRQCKHRIYTDDAQRGLGVWRDRGRIVYHAGNHLRIDQDRIRLSAIDSQYAYTACPSVIEPGEPLSDSEAAAVLDVASINSWEDATHAYIVAGWVMCALLAGTLKWRPSLWIQGAAGAGKSEVIKRYILGLLGPFAYNVMGDTTSAGVRQSVRCDARPVVMDESEPNNPKNSSQMAGLLQLMRQASSDTDAVTLRGSPSGRVQSFHIRSPFCFGSIQSALERGADIDRVTVVRLKSVKAGQIDKVTAEALYADWLREVDAWPVDMSARMLGRALQVAPIAREVIDQMTQALLRSGGVRDRREADQIGALMGGAWLMQASRVPTDQEASEWVGSQSWSEVFDRDEETDAEKALGALLGLVVVGDGDRASIADRIAAIDRSTGDIASTHERVLAWYGIRRINPRQAFIAYTCDLRKEALKHTLYPDVAGLLKQLPGAERNRQAQIAGKNCKGVVINYP